MYVCLFVCLYETHVSICNQGCKPYTHQTHARVQGEPVEVCSQNPYMNAPDCVCSEGLSKLKPEMSSDKLFDMARPARWKWVSPHACVSTCPWGMYSKPAATKPATANVTNTTRECAVCVSPDDDPQCRVDSQAHVVGTFVDRVSYPEDPDKWLMPWKSTPHCTQDSATGQFDFVCDQCFPDNDGEPEGPLQKRMAAEKESTGLDCEGRETFGRYKMLILPLQASGARRSLADEACWAPPEHFGMLVGGQRLPLYDVDGQRFNSSTDPLAQFSVFGSIAFLMLLAVFLSFQDVISTFPDDHKCMRNSFKVRCKECCHQKCCQCRESVAKMTASVVYYVLATVPFAMFTTLFLEPGKPLGTFIGGDLDAEDQLLGEVERIFELQYAGGALFRPSIEGSETILMMLFISGCILPLVCLIPFFYIFASILVFIFFIMTSVQNVDFFMLEHLVFAVNIDWSNFRPVLPSMLTFPAWCVIALGFTRLASFMASCCVRVPNMNSSVGALASSVQLAREPCEAAPRRSRPCSADAGTATMEAAQGNAETAFDAYEAAADAVGNKQQDGGNKQEEKKHASHSP